MVQATETQESKGKDKALQPVGWLALGMAMGFTAFSLFRKRKSDPAELFDVDSILRSCDRAAARMESLLSEDQQVKAS